LIVVLGAPATADGMPGPALQRRLRCAQELLRRNPSACVLATGGVQPRAASDRPEATVIAARLCAQGLPADRILVEPTARSTWENAVRSVRLLDAAPRKFDPVLLVTDPWHLPRALLAFRTQGLRAHGAACWALPGERPAGLWRLLAHELVGFCAYLLRWLWLILRRWLGSPPAPG